MTEDTQAFPLHLLRPELLAIKPYSSARSEFTGSGNIQLDANENPFPPYGHSGLRAAVNRYPQPQDQALRQRLADIYAVDCKNLLLTRGMDEAIDLLIRLSCEPHRDHIAFTPPTFGYYRVAAALNVVPCREFPLNEAQGFLPDWNALGQAQNVKVFFLCTPNNPTGTLLNLPDIEALCQAQHNKAIVAVDEAYLEFSEQSSATTMLQRCPNLVVMKTLSKAHGLAGARIGALIANPQLISALKAILPPYPLPSPSIEIALQALSPLGLAYTADRLQILREQKQLLIERLRDLPQLVKIYPSVANFILLQVKDASAIYERLRARGIIVRNRHADIPNTLRISIGSPEENILLLAALGLPTGDVPQFRNATKMRKTGETEIVVEVIFDQQGKSQIHTGLYFFDHMLEQLSRHSGISMRIRAIGDIHVDAHHTVEDVAIVLGQALQEALGEKRGIQRYGFVVPMDEAEARVSIDLCGRGHLEFTGTFSTEKVGDLPTEMVAHFFHSLAHNMQAVLHLEIFGSNNHHMIEACFKGLAKALGQAVALIGNDLPSTKGVL